MAVGTVSGVNSDDVWQLIATANPSSATSTDFTSISGYKKLMITYSVTFATDDRFFLRFNGDSTSGNYGSIGVLYSNLGATRQYQQIVMSAYPDSTTAGYVSFRDTDKTTPKFIDDFAGFGTGTLNGVYFGTSPISSINIFPGSGYAYTGTIKLYGVAA